MLNSLFEGQSRASWLSPSKRFVRQLCWEIYFPYDESREAASFPAELFQSSPRRAHRIVNGVSERITPHASLATGFEESPRENGLQQDDEIRGMGWILFISFYFLIPCANREAFQPFLWVLHQLRKSLAFHFTIILAQGGHFLFNP